MTYFFRDLRDRITYRIELLVERCIDTLHGYAEVMRGPLTILAALAVLMTIRAARRGVAKGKSSLWSSNPSSGYGGGYGSGSGSGSGSGFYGSWSGGSSAGSSTADIVDRYSTSVKVADGTFLDYGGVSAFEGQIETVQCYDSASTVMTALNQPGTGKVLVVDAGASRRAAVFDSDMAFAAQRNGWKGVIINGSVRKAKSIKSVSIGVKALGTTPTKGNSAQGSKGAALSFGGVQFNPGWFVYADEDGIVVSQSSVSVGGAGGGGTSRYGASTGGYGASTGGYGASTGGYGGGTTGGYGGATTGSTGYAATTGGYGGGATTGGYGATTTTGGYGGGATTGGYGAGATTGGYGAGSTTGGYGAGATTGGYGAGSTTGGYGAGATTGGYGAGSTTGGYGAGSTYGATTTGGSAYGATPAYGASTSTYNAGSSYASRGVYRGLRSKEGIGDPVDDSGATGIEIDVVQDSKYDADTGKDPQLVRERE